LTQVGDTNAKRVFKEEILKRFEDCENNLYISTIEYLIVQNYVEFFNETEISLLSEIIKKIILKLSEDPYRINDLFHLLTLNLLKYVTNYDYEFLIKKIKNIDVKNRIQLIHNINFNPKVIQKRENYQ